MSTTFPPNSPLARLRASTLLKPSSKDKNIKRVLQVTRLRLRRAGAGLGLAIVALGANHSFGQVNQATADAALNGYNSAFLVTSGSLTYYKKGTGTSTTDLKPQGTWGEALDIGVAEDAYERTGTAAAKTLVSNLMTTFLTQNGTDWSGDTWNDDLGWMCLCCMRGYQITGNSTFLTVAENNFNTAYNRGWDSTFGGGVWENMATLASKCALDNDGLAIVGCYIYQATEDTTYLTKAQNMYSWVRSKIFNTTTGQINEGWKADGLEVSDNVYNSGTFVNMANLLHNITGTASYYNDAVLAANHVVNKTAILSNGSRASNCWAQDFVRGLRNLCRDNHLWDTYYPWLENNANASWNERRTDLNITWNSWTSATPTDDCSSMESMSGAIVQQMLPCTYEPDLLTIPGYSGPDYRVIADSNFRDGEGVILDATAAGNYIAFLAPEISARSYDVRVAVKKFNSRGIIQMAIGQVGNNSPVNTGAPQDLYSSSAQYVELDLGTWTPATSGDKWIWFKITGKNAASSGYSVCFDYIRLLPIK